MKLLALCPTYGRRPALLENSIQCFLSQEYEHKALYILDDLGNILPQQGRQWNLDSTSRRFPSLPDKYQAMWEFCDGNFSFDAIVVWEDDDLYLPWHLSSIANSLMGDAKWCHPLEVWSTYRNPPVKEGASGRFHAALAFRRELIGQIGGWIGAQIPGHERRADFDQQLIAALGKYGGPPGRYDKIQSKGPSYVFRWADTGHVHDQTFHKGPDDEEGWERSRHVIAHPDLVSRLSPKFDEAALKTFAEIRRQMEVQV